MFYLALLHPRQYKELSVSVKTTIATGVVQALNQAVSGFQQLGDMDPAINVDPFVEDLVEIAEAIQQAIDYWQEEPTPNMEAPMEDGE